jgi:peptidoglycan hydrolase-like protein with peptidoglycan-binding domain
MMGPRTRAALIDYQKSEGLTPTGRWDDDTRARLGVTARTVPDQTAVSASPADPKGERPDSDTPVPSKRNAP